jgi:hypothetical protein
MPVFGLLPTCRWRAGDEGRRTRLAGGALRANIAVGCLATLERNRDYLLAPDAFENILFVPYSAMASLIQFLLHPFA